MVAATIERKEYWAPTERSYSPAIIRTPTPSAIKPSGAIDFNVTVMLA